MFKEINYEYPFMVSKFYSQRKDSTGLALAALNA